MSILENKKALDEEEIGAASGGLAAVEDDGTNVEQYRQQFLALYGTLKCPGCKTIAAVSIRSYQPRQILQMVKTHSLTCVKCQKTSKLP